MTNDEFKIIVVGSSETLKLLANQPDFQKLSQTVIAPSFQDIVSGEFDEILLGDALNKAILLLNLVYEGLDRQVPQQHLFDLLGVD